MVIQHPCFGDEYYENLEYEYFMHERMVTHILTHCVGKLLFQRAHPEAERGRLGGV